jgi:hypothetical protein
LGQIRESLLWYEHSYMIKTNTASSSHKGLLWSLYADTSGYQVPGFLIGSHACRLNHTRHLETDQTSCFSSSLGMIGCQQHRSGIMRCGSVLGNVDAGYSWLSNEVVRSNTTTHKIRAWQGLLTKGSYSYGNAAAKKASSKPCDFSPPAYRTHLRPEMQG